MLDGETVSAMEEQTGISGIRKVALGLEHSAEAGADPLGLVGFCRELEILF